VSKQTVEKRYRPTAGRAILGCNLLKAIELRSEAFWQTGYIRYGDDVVLEKNMLYRMSQWGVDLS
jgi:hypothetical protein